MPSVHAAHQVETRIEGPYEGGDPRGCKHSSTRCHPNHERTSTTFPSLNWAEALQSSRYGCPGQRTLSNAKFRYPVSQSERRLRIEWLRHIPQKHQIGLRNLERNSGDAHGLPHSLSEHM